MKHLQYKHSGTFANRKCEELSHPKKSENVRPHCWLVTLLKIWPHCSASSRENATPSSDTSPLASYKEVRPPPKGSRFQISLFWTSCFCFPTKMLHLNAPLFPLKCSVSPQKCHWNGRCWLSCSGYFINFNEHKPTNKKPKQQCVQVNAFHRAAVLGWHSSFVLNFDIK